MKLFEYDPATGQILRTMAYPNSSAPEMVKLLPDALFYPDGFDGDDSTHYVVNDEVVSRPLQNVVREGMTLKGVRKTATIKIGDKTYTCDGSNIELSFVRPGSYTVTVTDWPFVEWSEQIEVSA